MKQRKWNALLTLFSVIGGLLGFLVGEVMLNEWEGRMHETLLMGLYFGQFALLVGLFCLLAEIISPKLNGQSWRLRYVADGWKLLVPATLVMLFAAGALFQFLYGFTLEKKATQDYVLLLDMSESMLETDPGKQSIQAAQSFIRRMDNTKRVALFTFNNETKQVFPLTRLADAGTKQGLAVQLDKVYAPVGGTNIGGALSTVMDYLNNDGDRGRNVAVVLISDGYSDVDFARVLSPYKEKQVRVHTVGFVNTEARGNEVLQRIAGETGGTFQDVKRTEWIAGAFDQIYEQTHNRHLVNERMNVTEADGYYGLLRIALILLIGTLVGLSLGIMFDNRYLAKSFAIGGTIAGLLAGIILETGLHGALYPSLYRAYAAIALALVLSLSTLIVAIQSDSGGSGGFRRSRRDVAVRDSNRFGSRNEGPIGKRFRS